ncbi:little elongation complex subunit 1 [Anopheles bellator]|uniref:little elongation complex subunit 1 n=1 Tax=Anopheles bellator TaxID=139047 RepID=UPI0026490FD2|nr:little elongation complex subunit 1 [Anopheles bellator]
MSAEEFIYSAIGSDNVNHFDLNVIANTIASTDRLVRANKQQREENDKLKEKIASLRESALQIKNLYEAEVAKFTRSEAQLESYVSKFRQLEQQILAAVGDKLACEHTLETRTEEFEQRSEALSRRYHSFACDLVRQYYKTHSEQLTPNVDPLHKRRDLVSHFATVDKWGLSVPEDVQESLQRGLLRSKRKKPRDSRDMRDQECQTTAVDRCRMRDNHTSTEPYPVRPTVRHCSTDVADLPGQPGVTAVEPTKAFCDKSTMHSMSTITRSTCTSAFIKHVDVGVNFPEVTHKSVDEILRECVPLPPLLLSPIKEIVPLRVTIETQTESSAQAQGTACRPPVASCGTMTGLKNIRKRIDYRELPVGEASDSPYVSIKKEELPSTFYQADAGRKERINPHLSALWSLLGETIFTIIESGRRLDSQCFNVLNDHMASIRGMLEADGHRSSMLMSEMFSNVRETVVAATGVTKDRTFAPNNASSTGSCAAVPLTNDDGSSDSGNAWDFRTTDDTISAGGKESTIDLSQPSFNLSGTRLTKDMNHNATIAPSIAAPVSQEAARNSNATQSQDEPVRDVAQSSSVIERRNCDKTLDDLGQLVTATSSPIEEDEMDDRIAQELRMMEEGECASHHNSEPLVLSIERRPLPTIMQLPVGCTYPSEEPSKHQNPLETLDKVAELPRRSATPPPASMASPEHPSSTATFLSPIKVKETNELVKDQFKTPTQLPIGKRRKLRLRRSDEPLLSHQWKRSRTEEPTMGSGRVSPSTEFLLEDDWDLKFSSMRAEMNPIDADFFSPLSPIGDGDASEESPDGDEDGRPMEDEEEVGCKLVSSFDPSKDAIRDCIEESAKECTDLVRGISENRRPPETREPENVSSPQNGAAEESRTATTLAQQRVLNEERRCVTSEPLAIDHTKQEISPVPANEAAPLSVTPSPVPDRTEEGTIVVELNSSDKTCELQIDVPLAALSDSPESPAWDSPLSPPAHETGSSTCQLLAALSSPSTHSMDSPLSPPIVASGSTPSARPIPLQHEASKLFLMQSIHDWTRKGPLLCAINEFKKELRIEVIRRIGGQLVDQEQSAMQAMTDVIHRYLRSEWTEETVSETTAQMLACCRDPRTISLTVLEVVASYGNINPNNLFSSPAPCVPLTQQMLVLLVRRLGQTVESLDGVIMQELDRRIFTLKTEPVLLQTLVAITYMYVALEDSKPIPRGISYHQFKYQRCNTARLYIFKCLYYFGFKCVPLVYLVMRAFPHALPKLGSPMYDHSDAMVNTIRTVLMNFNYLDGPNTSDTSAYRKREMYNLLKLTYGYQPGNPSYEELLVNLVEKLQANKLRNVSYSLILIAKRKGYEWARKHIIQQRLLPLLNDYLRQFKTSRTTDGCETVAFNNGATSDRIVTCIFTISSILKTQPSHEDVTGMMQIFTTVVQLSNHHQKVQEAAIAGILRLSRFGYIDIWERLSTWQPDYPVSDRIKLMMATLVHRKDLRFWTQLLQKRIV